MTATYSEPGSALYTSLEGATAMVFGGAGGIGAAVCASLAAAGAQVAVADLDGQRAADVAATLASSDSGSHADIRADVTDPDSVKEAVGTTVRRLGRPNVLVNCAGFPRDRKLVEMTDADWDAVLSVALYGTFATCRAVVPIMKEAGYGRIVNISSRAHWGNPGQANYSAAKAGIIGLTRSMAKEVGRHNITVNAVAPGLIETEAVRRLERFEQIKKLYLEGASVKRIGKPEDVANAVLFLASPASSLITGEVLHVSGGRYG